MRTSHPDLRHLPVVFQVVPDLSGDQYGEDMQCTGDRRLAESGQES